MTKAEVKKSIVSKTGYDKEYVSDIIESFLEVVTENMVAGKNVYIRGFGSFVNKKKAKKIGRNITKNVAVVIAAHYAPTFKPSKIFADKVKKSLKV